MMFFGWLAITGLTYINPAPLEVATPPSPEVSESPSPFRIDKPATSFGILAIVAITCATSSVFLARRLRPVKPAPRRVIKRTQPTETVRSQKDRKPINSAIPPANLKPAPTAIAAKPKARPPAVTLLSAEEENPLEMGDTNLAEMLDIRQQAKG